MLRSVSVARSGTSEGEGEVAGRSRTFAAEPDRAWCVLAAVVAGADTGVV
jgi:hypothetical protein